MHMAAIQCRMVANLKSKNHPIMDNNLHLYLDIPLNKIESDKSYFRRTLMEAVSIGAFLSFVSSSHTFSLPLELVITFSLLMLSVTIALSMSDTKDRKSTRLNYSH